MIGRLYSVTFSSFKRLVSYTSSMGSSSLLSVGLNFMGFIHPSFLLVRTFADIVSESRDLDWIGCWHGFVVMMVSWVFWVIAGVGVSKTVAGLLGLTPHLHFCPSQNFTFLCAGVLSSGYWIYCTHYHFVPYKAPEYILLL
ncbi:uncharacterized protein BO95DRAFT_57979 [Aspergillus brunneoviolaceus CBS 621.78]|uniref:Uncharacterized protein n=1 Tax=Aspergillus brunneoviolaceus CBS 621.78 TaxID=1450534 RepID=A0ACD1GGW1_9EURO|nr:hypothetical protein BO95DRAFT_57979 [Aspergillus brunneoviolaceus CBS 621.78]RAH48412.1 hypothetical protein BO95DRAFT_57979 [Aspergillus brunneoviolaceus CBS 621.78]